MRSPRVPALPDGKTALLLASDLASFIASQSIVVDGEQTLPEIKQ